MPFYLCTLECQINGGTGGLNKKTDWKLQYQQYVSLMYYETNKWWGSGEGGEFIWYSRVIHLVFNKMSFPCNSYCINSMTVTATVPWVIKFHLVKSVSSLIKSRFVLGSVANKVNYSIIKVVTSLFQISPNRIKLTKSIVFFYHF